MMNRSSMSKQMMKKGGTAELTPTEKKRLKSIRNNSPKPDDPPAGNRELPRKTPAANTSRMMKGGMAKYAKGGLKKPTESQVGIKKLPAKVRNKMGFMKKGGDVEKMNMGGMAGMDDAAMMAMKKKRKKPMTPAQQAMSGGTAMPMMKKGGMTKKKASKPRGYGMARGGKACKMR